MEDIRIKRAWGENRPAVTLNEEGQKQDRYRSKFNPSVPCSLWQNPFGDITLRDSKLIAWDTILSSDSKEKSR